MLLAATPAGPAPMTPDGLFALSDRLAAEVRRMKAAIVGGTRKQWLAVDEIDRAARCLWSAAAGVTIDAEKRAKP